MTHFYEYDPLSTTRIQETHTIEDGIIVLRHIPRENSIVIDGFEEVTSLNLLPNQFFTHYSLNTYYRESNRTLVFSEHAEGRVVEVSYIVVGTPVLASDMNEIKAHLEGSEGGANNFSIGEGLSLTDGVLSANFTGLTLGKGLAFDANGNLCIDSQLSDEGWEYHDSGHDVIPPADFIYTDDTHFYQPVENSFYNDMFDTPQGVTEIWIRGDIFISNDFTSGDIIRIGCADQKVSAIEISAYRGGFGDRLWFIQGTLANNYYVTNLSVGRGQENHFLLHMVGGENGYIECGLNNGSSSMQGTLNRGLPFSRFAAYSNSAHALFSNLTVSTVRLEY